MLQCVYTDVFPKSPPEEVEKVWTFTKTSTALTVSCNGVEVLSVVFGGSSVTECVAMGSWDVESIEFDGALDTASDFYRAKPTCK